MQFDPVLYTSSDCDMPNDENPPQQSGRASTVGAGSAREPRAGDCRIRD